MTTRAPNEQIEVDGVQENVADGQLSTDSEKTIGAGEADSSPAEGNTAVDVPPDGGYGWVCTGCVLLINAHTWGVNSVSPLQRVLLDCGSVAKR